MKTSSLLEILPVKPCIRAIAICFLFLVFACSREAPTELVIGGVLPLTGDAATFGRNASRGAELAIAEANKSGILGKQKLSWKAEDSRGAATQAVSAARKLIDVDHAQMLVGDVTSAGTHAMIPVITEQKRPTISPAASDPKLRNSSPFFARVWPSDVYESEVIGKYAVQKKYARIAAVYANTDYGVGMVDAFKRAVPADTITLVIPTERENLDYRATIKRIQIAKSDALFLVMYPEDAKRFLQQLKELGVGMPILATATFEDPKLADQPGAEMVIFASPLPPSNDDQNRKQFVEAYKKMFAEEPAVLSDTGYDAAKILIEAYAKHGREGPEAVMAYIKSLTDYPGVSGKLSFDKTGDVIKKYKLRTVKDGKFAWLE